MLSEERQVTGLDSKERGHLFNDCLRCDLQVFLQHHFDLIGTKERLICGNGFMRKLLLSLNDVEPDKAADAID